MAFDRREKAVDVDLAPAFGEGDVLFGTEVLLAEEDHPELAEGASDLGKSRIALRLAQIDASGDGTEAAARRGRGDV